SPGRDRDRVASRVLAEPLGRAGRLRGGRSRRLRDRELRAQGDRLSGGRARVLQIAESRDLLVVGASDNHGWGQVTCVWNLSSPSAHGFRSNRVIARPIALAQGEWQPWTAAYTQPWLMLAGLSWSERSSWLTWLLVILIYRAVPRREGDPGGIGILARSLSLKILRLRRPPPPPPPTD